MTRAEKKANRKIEKEIEYIFGMYCQGIQIAMMDVVEVFKVGREAHAKGEDMREAICKFVETIRKN